MLLLPAVIPNSEPIIRITSTLSLNFDDYSLDYLVWGGKFSMDGFNLFSGFGLGMTYFYKDIYYSISYQNMAYFEFYGNFITNSYHVGEFKKNKAMLFSFNYGVRFYQLEYYNYHEDRTGFANMIIPVAGIELISKIIGVSLKATFDEKFRLRFEYEIKTYGLRNIVFQIGGTIGNRLFGIPSDFHIYSGYEIII